MNANRQPLANCSACTIESCILQLASCLRFGQVIDLQGGECNLMKGTFYAFIWCSAPSSGAYTPMGISQYSRLSQPKDSAGTHPWEPWHRSTWIL